MRISSISLIRLYFSLAALEGVAALVTVLGASSEAANTWLFGYSLTRLVIAGVLAATTVLFGVSAWLAVQRPDWVETKAEGIKKWLSGGRWYFSLLISLFAILIAGYYLYALSGQINDNLIRVRLERLRPVLIWLMLLCAQTIPVLPLLRYGSGILTIKQLRGTLRTTLLIFLGFMAVGVYMSWTRQGYEADLVGWDNPGAPVLALQVLVVIMLALGALGTGLLIARRVKKYPKINSLGSRFLRADILFAALIWLVATNLWWSQPLTPTYFSPQLRAPNYEYYPYSDASLHDKAAQNLILGEGYQPVAEKPLYSLFLGMAHLIVGQEYSRVINLQIAILALFPVVLYLLATGFHHRLTGLLAAGLVIIRERNAIALSPQIRVSHSKLLMTDLPAAFLLALFVLILFWWLSNARRRRHGALLSGGALGLALLVRSQAILLIPAVLIGLALIMRPYWKRLFEAGGLFVGGVMIVILPWMVRNYQQSGQFGYSQPQQALYIAKQYSLTPEADDPGFPQDAPREDYTSLGFAQMLSFTGAHPGVVANFISAHFLRNEISTLFIFPLSYNNVAVGNQGANIFGADPFLWQSCCTLSAFVDSVPFWGEWAGTFNAESLLAVTINLLLISLGIGFAWRRWRFLGLLPLILHFTYSISVAVARISGWRLMLPMDWIAILYFCVGMSLVLLWGLAIFSGKQNEGGDAIEPTRSASDLDAIAFPIKASIRIGLLLLLLGLIVPLAEALFPQQFEPVSKQEAVTMLRATDWVEQLEPALSSFLEDSNAIALVGRALYPRYYPINEGEPGEYSEGSEALSSARITFYLAGPDNGLVVLPVTLVPSFFPNASDVLVLGCRREDYVEAYAVILLDSENELVYLDDREPYHACALLTSE